MNDFRLYDALIRPVREMDVQHGGKWLEKYLERPQTYHEKTRESIKGLPTLYSIEECPAEYLDYLLWIVNFTRRYRSIVERLDENTKRRLLRLAVPMWKQLFTWYGTKRFVRLLTGKTPYVRDWFDFRVIVGEVILGEDQVGYDFWVIGDAIARFDQYTSQIRLMDDGLLDETLLIRLLEIGRPIEERFECSLVDFLDVFQEGRSMWTTLTGTPAVISDYTFKVYNGTQEQPGIPIAPDTSFTNYLSMHKFNIQAAVGAHRYRFFVENVATDFYEVQVTPGLAGNIALTRWTGGVPVGIGIGGIPIVVGAWYKLRVRCQLIAGVGIRIRAWIDGNLVLNVLDAPVPVSPTYGKVYFAPSGSDVIIDNVELYRLPLRWAIIEPAGTTLGPGWVA